MKTIVILNKIRIKFIYQRDDLNDKQNAFKKTKTIMTNPYGFLKIFPITRISTKMKKLINSKIKYRISYYNDN
ncbi:hypothetical protein BpHYR1_040804 [Brachionus plicatilis]|uniref:Uncharacterized protein n=1 Tax=Brachionus plicatilis TaxID=10195 RepID=A0A3M7RKJ4_BRAPC|nr:hypothetical protein BpHYR1_040804 [Brachionus plicatilis]